MDNLTNIIDDIKILISFCIVIFKAIINLPNKYLNKNSIDPVSRLFNFNPFFSVFKFIQFPEQIIDNIYLGNVFCSVNKLSLKQNNIGLIINCSKEIPNFYNNERENIEYHQISILDNGKEKLSIQIINNAINKIVIFQTNSKKNILVHCFAGRSRSVSLIVCYLIYKYKMTPIQAIHYILKKRDYINPSEILYNSCISYYNYITHNKKTT